MRAEQGPYEPIKGCIREIREQWWAREAQSMPERGSESQWEPEWESQRAIEPERDRERSSKSLREQVKAKKEASLTFVAYLNIVLLQNTSKYGIFCRKLLKYALWAKKMAASAMRADSTLCLTLPDYSAPDYSTPDYMCTWLHVHLITCAPDYMCTWLECTWWYVHLITCAPDCSTPDYMCTDVLYTGVLSFADIIASPLQ